MHLREKISGISLALLAGATCAKSLQRDVSSEVWLIAKNPEYIMVSAQAVPPNAQCVQLPHGKGYIVKREDMPPTSYRELSRDEIQIVDSAPNCKQ